MLAQKSSPASTTLRLTKWSGEVVVDDKVDEGKGWSARQAPTTKTHNTHILVVSKRTHYCSKYLSIKFTTPTPALSKVLKKTKTLFSRARGSTCYRPGRRAQTERSSSDQDLPATVQLVPKICRHPPTGQLVPLRLITADSSPVQHFRLVFQRGKATGRDIGQELDGKTIYSIETVLYVLSYKHHFA